MSKIEFTENYLFQKYKNVPFGSCKSFKKEVKDYKGIDAYKVYRMILNYQIKTYGIALNSYRTPSVPLEVLRARVSSRRKYKNSKLGKDFKMERWVKNDEED